MRHLFLATTALVGFASNVMAGDAGPAAPTPELYAVTEPDATWTGFYAGGLASVDNGDITFDNGGPLIGPFAMVQTTSYGGFVGYNRQVNSLVFGGELAYTTGDVPSQALATSRFSDRVDLKGRIGRSFGRAMVYGVVGYSFATFIDGGIIFDGSGLNYGVGVDVLLGENMFMGAEYLMRDIYGSNGVSTDSISNLDSFSLRFGIRF